MNEVAFRAHETPSPGLYKPRYEVKSQFERSPQANLNRHKSERPALVPFKKVDGPNPFSYKDVDTNWKLLSHHEDHS